MINTLSKIILSKIGWEGGGSTSIWIMSVNILFCFFDGTPKVTPVPTRTDRYKKSPLPFLTDLLNLR